MSKRNKKGQFRRKYTIKFIAATWVAAFASVGLLYIAAAAVASSFGAFRSCSSNDTNLLVQACGKQGLNVGDLLLLVLFVLAAALTVSLFTAAWRMTKKEPIS